MPTFQKIKRKALRALFQYDPSYTDIFEDKSEAYFARLYLHAMGSYLAQLPDGAKILDAGCQAGRFTVALAKMGFRISAIDTSALSLHRAKKHCRDNGVYAELIRGDIGEICGRWTSEPFDAILCTEVLYLHRHFEELIGSMLRVLKSKGLFISSHRTKFYYLIRALRQKDLATARRIIQSQEGALWGTYFNWQTVNQLKELHKRHQLVTLRIHPIGIFSEMITSPGQLDRPTQEILFEIEKEPFDEVSGCTRYLLAIGQKVPATDSHLP